MTVVSNTSPITNLAAIGHLEMLQHLFGTVAIPEAVSRELSASSPTALGAVDLDQFPWIVVRAVEDEALVVSLTLSLDEGEAEAIALARETNCDLVLIDERRGRRAAAKLGLKPLGLLGVLLLAKRKGAIAAVKPLLNALRNEAGFWFGEELYQRVLAEANEA